MLRKIFTSSLIRSAGIYTVANIINAAIPFFMLPVLTRYMTPEDYGYVAIFQILVTFIIPFVGLSMHGAINRKYFDAQIDLPQYITNCLMISVISVAIVSVIFVYFSGVIADLVRFPAEWLGIVGLTAFFQFITFIILTLWQAQSKPLFYGAYQISQTTINVMMTILLVVVLGMSWQGRIEAQLITAFVFAIVGIYLLHRGGWLKFTFNKSYSLNALHFGVPLIPHALGAIAMQMTGRIFISNMVGISETGLYMVAYQVATVVEMIGDSFVQACVPWLYGRLNENSFADKQKIVKITYAYYIGLAVLAMALTFLTPWFFSFFVGKAFQGSSVFIFWIALSFVFAGMYKMVAVYAFYTERTSMLARVTGISTFINIALTYILIRKNGAIGAAQAAAITYLIFFVLTWILSVRLCKMPWFNFITKRD